jgi:hypothetical protein
MSGVPRERAAISKFDSVWAVAGVAIAHKASNTPTIRSLMSLVSEGVS